MSNALSERDVELGDVVAESSVASTGSINLISPDNEGPISVRKKVDPIDPISGLPRGYSVLAREMSLITETTSFRAFSDCQNEDIAHQQLNLIILEQELRQVEKEDAVSENENRRMFAQDGEYLTRAMESSNAPEDRKQGELRLKIREALKCYRRTLLETSQIQKLEPPSQFDLNHLQCFIESDTMHRQLKGKDSLTWGSKEKPDSAATDLVALVPRYKSDLLTEWLISNLRWLFRFNGFGIFKPQRMHGMRVYTGSGLRRVMKGITTLLAVSVTCAAIITINYLVSVGWKLAAISIFIVVGAILLNVLSIPTHKDILVFVLAIAAVLVTLLNNGPNDAVA